jgi:adenosine deaminase
MTHRPHTELHRHLDASFRASTLAELSRESSEEPRFESADEVRDRFWITRQMGSLKEVLDCFVVFQRLLKTPAILERVAREAVEDAAAEGIGRLELRYSPEFTSEYSGIPWDKALAAFERGARGAAEALGVEVGLICIVSRGYSDEVTDRTIDFAAANRERFIGVDLAGVEEGFPCRLFERAFRRARAAGLPVTIHAGEGAGPENIWEAIDLLGATRIGHGMRALEDSALIRRLARDGILLETCPTSNFVTKSIATFRDHPLPRFLEAGVPVSISTDDPGIFGVTIGEEYARCRSYLGMSEAELAKIDEYARAHSFLK